MKSQRHTPQGSLKKWFLIACVAALLCLSHGAFAQSGRRSKSAASPPTPVAPEPKAEPTASPANVKPAAHTSIVVGKDRFGSTNFVLDSYAGEAMRACIERINDSKGLEATGVADMTRKDAIDRAKKGEAHVLWLEIKDEQGGDNDISISYSVYMPETAKILTSGRVYLGTRGAGTGGVIVGVPSASRRLPLQYQMREGGKEVADRVVSKLGVTIQDGHP